MEFLRSLLTRRFARAQVAASRNVGCFFRLFIVKILELVLGQNWLKSAKGRNHEKVKILLFWYRNLQSLILAAYSCH